MCSIQRLRLTAGKRLALVALRTQAFEDQPNRCAALLHCRFASVQNDHGPRAAGTQRKSLYDSTLVRRGLVVKRLPIVPALARRARGDQFKWPLGFGFVGGAAASDRGTGIDCLGVD